MCLKAILKSQQRGSPGPLGLSNHKKITISLPNCIFLAPKVVAAITQRNNEIVRSTAMSLLNTLLKNKEYFNKIFQGLLYHLKPQIQWHYWSFGSCVRAFAILLLSFILENSTVESGCPNWHNAHIKFREKLLSRFLNVKGEMNRAYNMAISHQSTLFPFM